MVKVLPFHLQFIKSVVSEANDVIGDIQSTLNEQKQILAFSAQQQEEVCPFILQLFPLLLPVKTC